MKFLFNKVTVFLLTAKTVASFTLSPLNGAPTMRRSTQLLASARKPFITGNWKLNPQTRDEAVQLAKEISNAVGSETGDIDVALFVPYVFIESAMKAVEGKVQIGAEVRPSQHSIFLQLTILKYWCCLSCHYLSISMFSLRVFAHKYKGPLQELSQPQC